MKGLETSISRKTEMPSDPLKDWQRQYQLWLQRKGPKPDAHPDPNHKWNTNPELYEDLDYDY